MHVELMSADHESAYDRFCQLKETDLLYTSLAYRNFLKKILPTARDSYFLAFDQGELIGALPSFLLNGEYGAVINSLPFYGSCAALMVHPNSENPNRVKKSLLDAFDNFARANKAVSTTLISNPLEAAHEYYLENSKPTCCDDRIGQITMLPALDELHCEASEALMGLFHTKTRNMVRKSMKYGFQVKHSSSEAVMRQLWEIHVENMKSIGGQAKEWSVFSGIREVFDYDTQYRVYYAESEGETVAALLVLYYNKTVEYFTPVIRESWRSFQPLSLLIFEAMMDACHRKIKYWNWGGTWLSQKGVYLFKHRWGAQDMPYRYYVREYPEHGTFRNVSRKELLAAYPSFFTIPFDCLEESE